MTRYSLPTRRANGLPTSLTSGKEIGRGGEGAVFEVAGEEALVVKVYHKVPPRERQEKLCRMAEMDVGGLRDLAAWPIDVVSAPPAKKGEINGFVMPRIAGYQDVHFLYSPKSRRERFPEADFRFVVRAASNVAKAFATAHAAGVVIGDVNFGGVTISKQATVRLLDCDSFQIAAGDKIFRCEVAMPLFTPPELVGKPLHATVRTPNHDAFGLAVLIFQLLMMGRHPFAGRFSGVGEMTPEKAIAEFRYVYGSRAGLVNMAPPPGVPSVEQVAGAAIAAAFEEAFGPKGPSGSRPDALRWAGLLDELADRLGRCSRNPSHWALDPRDCPWCEAEEATGVSMFGKATALLEGGLANARQIAAALGAALAMGLPEAEKLPEPIERKDTRLLRTRVAVKLLWFVAAYVLAGRLYDVTGWFWIPLGIMWIAGKYGIEWGFRRRWRGRAARADLQARRDLLERERKAAVKVYEDLCEEQAREFERRRLLVRRDFDELQQLPKARAAKLQWMRVNQPEVQMLAHLRKFPIAEAVIPGVGKARKHVLADHGFVTAADLHPGMGRDLPGFGAVLEGQLLQWRRAMGADFVYDPTLKVSRAEVELVRREMDERQRGCELRILQAKDTLTRLAEIFLDRRRQAAELVAEKVAAIEALDEELAK